MTPYTMKARPLPLYDSWDVIVVGGGPAGCTAAIAAAREGARTLLVEGTGCLGGMGTAGLVPAWCPFSDQEKIIHRGLAEKIFSACKHGMPHVNSDATDWVPIDPERLKRIYDDLVTQSGASVLFNTVLAAVEMENESTIHALILSNKSGLAAYQAKIYVDSTGDADLAAWAGAEFQKGEEKTGQLQPVTLCFILSNVDEYAYRTGPKLYNRNPKSPIHPIFDSGKFPDIQDKHLCNSLIGPGTVGFNAGHQWQVDNTDPVGVSRALIQGRKTAAAFRDALAEFYPKAFANAFLAATGALMGIRETRRILGDYVLTVEDYLARRNFPDEICRNAYFIDVHQSRREADLEREGKFDWNQRCAYYEKGESHGIPYRCLTPKGLRNVLVAGRSISCDRLVQGSVRVMPVCLSMGEAAGIAAALGTQMSVPDVHAIDIGQLKQRINNWVNSAPAATGKTGEI